MKRWYHLTETGYEQLASGSVPAA